MHRTTRLWVSRPAWEGLDLRVWEHWEKESEVIESCSFTVTDSIELVKHDPQPLSVILKPEDYSLWLDPAMTETQTIKPLLQLYPAEEKVAWQVSTRANNVKQEDPGLIEPLASESNPSLF